MMLSCTGFTNYCNGKKVLGVIEPILLVNEDITIPAKLDTGASMSSLCVKKNRLITKHNKPWVRFSICESQKTIFKPLVGFVTIRSRNEENGSNIKRPVILLPLKIQSETQVIRVNLTDRSDFHYRLLLGRDALIKFNLIVDPNRYAKQAEF